MSRNLAGIIQERYGITKEEAKRQIDSFDPSRDPSRAETPKDYQRKAG